MSIDWDPLEDPPEGQELDGWGNKGRRSRRDENVEIPNVRAQRETERALFCELPDKSTRWVPKSQILGGDVHGAGDEGTLGITTWLSKKWEEEGAPEAQATVDVPDVVALQETQKALLVRIGSSGDEVWVPKGHIMPGSEVRNDGDMGTLVISEWLAKEKKLGENVR